MPRRLSFSFLILSFTAPVVAQDLSCAVAAPFIPTIRAEGFAELVGDVVVRCTGGVPTPAGQGIYAPLTGLYGPVEFTSRLGTLGNVGGSVDALILLDEPAPNTQYQCGVGCIGNYGNGTGLPTYYGGGPSSPSTPSNRNVFGVFNVNVLLAGISGGDLYYQVPFDPPGPGNTRTIRFTNIRINANQLGVRPGERRTVYLTVWGKTVAVAYVERGLSSSLRNASNSAPMATIPWNPLGASTPQPIATLRYEEGFASVFKRRTAAPPAGQTSPPPANQNQPGAVYLTESGFHNSAFPPVTGSAFSPGLADSGTRLAARFSGLPAGAQIFVQAAPPVVPLQSGTLGLARATNSGRLGDLPFSASPADANGLSPVLPQEGSVNAIWEILDTNPAALERVDIAVYATYPPGTNRPDGQVLLDLAPIDVPMQTAIPRFAMRGGWAVPGSCTFRTFAPIPVPFTGGTVNISVYTDPGCEWKAESNAPWLTSSGPIQGLARVPLTADINPGPPRTAQVTVGDKTVTVTQSGGGAAAYPAPAITAPLPNEIIAVSGITFSWNPVTIATNGGTRFYDVRIFDGGKPIYQGTSISESILIDIPYGDLTTPAVIPRNYNFLVRACVEPPGPGAAMSFTVDDANCGPFGVRSFQPNPPQPPTPTQITAPVTNQVFTNSTIAFQWQPVAGVAFYRVMVARGTETVLQLRVPASATSTVYSLPAGSYAVAVQSCAIICDAFHNMSGQNFINFRIDLPAIPNAAPVISQATVTGGNVLNATWNAIAGADFYRVQVVQPNSGPGGGALTVGSGQTATNGIALSVPAGAASVFVAACNGNGCGPNSAGSSINPAGPNPAVPILGSPIPGSSVNGPSTLFTWSRVPGDNGSNTGYRLFVADLGRSTTAADVYTSSNFAGVQLGAEGRRYDAVVVARPGTGQIVGPATGFQVLGISPNAPTLSAPGHQSTVKAGNVLIGWTPVPGAVSYEYWVAPAGASRPVASGIAPGTFVMVPLAASGTQYSAIVRACVNADGCASGFWGPWSNDPGGPGVTNFTVVP